jgi:hypothetical protein
MNVHLIIICCFRAYLSDDNSTDSQAWPPQTYENRLHVTCGARVATMPVFDEVSFVVSPSLPLHSQRDISHLLLVNGAAIAASINEATHIISNTNRFEGWQNIPDTLAVVTERWVQKSVVLGKMQQLVACLKVSQAHSSYFS